MKKYTIDIWHSIFVCSINILYLCLWPKLATLFFLDYVNYKDVCKLHIRVIKHMFSKTSIYYINWSYIFLLFTWKYTLAKNIIIRYFITSTLFIFLLYIELIAIYLLLKIIDIGKICWLWFQICIVEWNNAALNRHIYGILTLSMSEWC